MSTLKVESETTIEQAALVLLEATEKLFEAVAEGADAEILTEEYSGRESAFEVFRDAVESAGGPQDAPISATARECLQRVSSFDSDLIAAGISLVESLRDERRELARVRSATKKHSVREREQPRVVTIKA